MTQQPKAKSKAGAFLWTRQQVQKAIEAEAQQWHGIVEGQSQEIAHLRDELEEARNVVRSVVKHGAALDKALTGWLAKKEAPDVEADDPPGDATPEPHHEQQEAP